MKRGTLIEMKILKQILFTFAVVVGLSLTAFAQKGDGDRKPPKKEKPPVVNPEQKPPREKPRDNDRNNDNRGKKPGMAFIKTEDETEVI
jgi:hypothetical protein